MTEAAPTRVLIVEDDPDMAEAAQIVLGSAGYETRCASSAEEGLCEIQTFRPQLILLDVMMPAGTEGFHLVWELRKDPNPALRDLPIIIMTALHSSTKLRFYPDQSDGVYAPYEYLPVQGFLDKPAASEDLLEAVARALHEAGGG